MTDGQIMPPPLPRSETAAEWFVIKDGARLGPVTESAIRSMLGRREIEPDAQVWRNGMSEWKQIRHSDLADLVAAEPPPISSAHIGSGFVWVLAFLPLLFCLIEASIEASNQQAAARTLSLGFPYAPSRGLPPQIPLVLNALLGWLDYRRLEKAGYKSWGLRAAAVLLPPAYLFMRASRLKQRPSYAITWLVCLFIGILIYGSAMG